MSSQSRAPHWGVFYHVGDEGGRSASLAPWLRLPESTRSLTCELRPQPPQQSPSNSCPSHGQEDSRPPKTRLRGCGGPPAKGRESPGNLMYSTRLGARPLPSSRAAPAFPLGGLCAPPTGTSPRLQLRWKRKVGATFLEQQSSCPRREPTGARSGPAALQILHGVFKGQKSLWSRPDFVKPRTPGFPCPFLTREVQPCPPS